MQIKKPVDLSYILLYTHECGDLTNDQIPDAAATPDFSIVDANGQIVNVESDDAESDITAYGVHIGGGQVYHSLSVFNDKYIAWPDGMNDENKAKIREQLKKNHLILKCV